MSERRKDWFLGIPPAQWITLFIFISGGVYTVGVWSDQIDNNKRDIAETREQITNTEHRLIQKMDKDKREIREDIQELREDIKKMLRAK